jgi:hypothetical protein
MRIDQEVKYSSVEVERSRPEARDHRRTFLAAKLILAGVAVLAAGEASWRFAGFEPAASDLLAFDRLYTAARSSTDAVALIGDSRVLCDLDPTALKRELPPWNFYQLAADGTSGLAMLENLAQDDRFHGHVLCEFRMEQFQAAYPFLEHDTDPQRYVRFLRRRPYLDFVSTWLSETLGEHSALLQSKDRDFISSLAARIAGSGAKPLPDLASRGDRFLGMHRRGQDNSRAIASWNRMMAGRVHGDSGDHAASWVEAIRRRGGDVVFVRLPASGSLRQLEDTTYPDAAGTIESLAARGIHVVDSTKEPTLSGFDCPDESHLDEDDAERFSASLARILRDAQLLRPAPSNGL